MRAVCLLSYQSGDCWVLEMSRAFVNMLISFTPGFQFPGSMESGPYLSLATALCSLVSLGFKPSPMPPPRNVLTEHYVQSLATLLPFPSCMTVVSARLLVFPLLTLQQLPLTNVLKITSSVRYMETLGTWGIVGIFRATLRLLGNESKSSQPDCNTCYFMLAVSSWGNRTIWHV